MQAAEIDTVVDTRLVVDSRDDLAARRAREQRDRDAEHPRGVRRAGLAGAQARLQELRPLLRLRARRPGLLHRGRCTARTRRARASSATSSRPRAPSPTSPSATGRDGHACCASPTCSGPTCATSHARAALAARGPVILGFDPRYQFIHDDDVVGVLEFAVEHDLPGIYNVAADGVLALSEVIGLLGQARAAGPAAVGHGARPRPALRPLGVRMPARDAAPAALRPRARQPQAEGGRLPLPLHDPRDGRASSPSTCACAPCCSGGDEPYRYENEVEDFLRWSPSVRAQAASPRAARRVRTLTLPERLQAIPERRNRVRYSLDVAPHASPLPRLSIAIARRRAARRRAAASTPTTSGSDDQIADGVTVAGVDVGGLSAAQARAQAARRAAGAARPAGHASASRASRYTLTPDAGAASASTSTARSTRRSTRSREGDIFSRTVARGPRRADRRRPRARRSPTRAARSARFVARVQRDGQPRAARRRRRLRAGSVDRRSRPRDGRARARRARCAATSSARCWTPAGAASRGCARRSSSRRSRPTSSRRSIRRSLTVDRGGFKLRSTRTSSSAKTYTIAVGQVGLETPAGLYHVQNKAVNPAWHVPNSDWAGDLAGKVIPGGAPENPLKARWLGIFAGAGIHGTDADGSIGTRRLARLHPDGDPGRDGAVRPGPGRRPIYIA